MAKPEVTLLLESVNAGDTTAYAQLMQVVYGELRRLAQARMSSERAGHTLQPTALVNEAYLRLMGGDVQWEGRAHFFGAAAQAMRRVLVDHARKKSSQKRGGDVEHVTFSDLGVVAEDPGIDVLALDLALNALNDVDPRLSEVVHLRYFAGLSIEQTATALDVAPATVKRDWTYARAWLYEHMSA